MCLLIEEFSCGHRLHSIRRCWAYEQQKAEEASRTPWSHIRSVFQQRADCREPAQYRQRNYLCLTCARLAVSRAQENEHTRRAKATKREEARRRAEEEAEWRHRKQTKKEAEACALLARKMAFRCSACRHEQRQPSRRSRNVNNGLCCARGLEEFNPDYRYEEDVKLLMDATNMTEVIPGGSGEPSRDSELRNQRSDGAMLARAAGTLAARDYGWQAQSRDSLVEPHLMANFVNLAGVGVENLPAQTRPAPLPAAYYSPPPVEPVYEDPNMDLHRWDRISETAGHGTVPPAPEKPLPRIPHKQTGKATTYSSKHLPPLPTPELMRAGSGPDGPRRMHYEAQREVSLSPADTIHMPSQHDSIVAPKAEPPESSTYILPAKTYVPTALRVNVSSSSTGPQTIYPLSSPDTEQQVRMASLRGMPSQSSRHAAPSTIHQVLPSQRDDSRNPIARQSSSRAHSPVSSVGSAPDRTLSPVSDVSLSPAGTMPLEDLLDEAVESWKGFSKRNNLIKSKEPRNPVAFLGDRPVRKR